MPSVRGCECGVGKTLKRTYTQTHSAGQYQGESDSIPIHVCGEGGSGVEILPHDVHGSWTSETEVSTNCKSLWLKQSVRKGSVKKLRSSWTMHTRIQATNRTVPVRTTPRAKLLSPAGSLALTEGTERKKKRVLNCLTILTAPVTPVIGATSHPAGMLSRSTYLVCSHSVAARPPRKCARCV